MADTKTTVAAPPAKEVAPKVAVPSKAPEAPKSASVKVDTDIGVSGKAGRRFRIDGPPRSFGTFGTVRLNGAQLETTEWGASHIEGKLPDNARSGEVEVHSTAGTKRGYLTL